MPVNIFALVAPRDWPDDIPVEQVAMPPLDQRPHAFAILFGAGVVRVAGDGSLTLVMLDGGWIHYLRTGAHSVGRWRAQ